MISFFLFIIRHFSYPKCFNDLFTYRIHIFVKLYTQISEGGNDTQNGEKGKLPYFHFFNTVISL